MYFIGKLGCKSLTVIVETQDEDVPWYGDEYWDFVRGQLSSVDRDYGWAHNLVHNIGTHQVSDSVSLKKIWIFL